MDKKMDRHVDILGVPVFGGRNDEVLAVLWEKIAKKEIKLPVVVFTPNSEQVMLFQRNDMFVRSFFQADLCIPDGVGLVWADQMLAKKTGRKHTITERIAGVDVAENIVSEAAKRGKKVLLMGGAATIAKQASTNLKQRYNGLDIIGVQGPENLGTDSEEENQALLEEIKSIHPQIILVGFGAPKQEIWVANNKKVLGEMGVELVMVVGGALDVWAGVVRRAPQWWQKRGLEWLWRLIHQPWRLGRQLRLLEFVLKVIRYV